jgi:hypothetical protein
MNSIAPALKLLVREGMRQDEPVKLRKALQEIDRDSRRFKWDDESLESMPPEWQWRVCTARIQLGYLDYRGWQWRGARANCDPFDIPKWELGLPVYPVKTECSEPEKVDSLLIYSEQGVGDSIIFSQAFKYALPYAKNITIEVEPRLCSFMQRSYPEFKFHALTHLEDSDWVKEGQFDAKVLYGDLVARFMRSDEDYHNPPYIVLDNEKVEYWKKWLEDIPKPWVGYSWAGRQGFLKDMPCKGWINLQYDEKDIPEGLITPPINLKDDFEDVYAIVSSLDKVVCVPNTLAHIAGSIGKKCDVILTRGDGRINNACNYRWGMDSDRKMRWHPSITVYRNKSQWTHENR